MPILKSAIDKNGKEFAANRAHMEKLVADLREKQTKAALGGSEKSRKKHTDRGKLLPRERIEAL
ncbi:MAG: methylcrotonoyl-CoA carboxylase, partial [Gammaproteobacteria bacterium]